MSQKYDGPKAIPDDENRWHNRRCSGRGEAVQGFGAIEPDA